jgi:hypothetical protein
MFFYGTLLKNAKTKDYRVEWQRTNCLIFLCVFGKLLEKESVNNSKEFFACLRLKKILRISFFLKFNKEMK